MKNFGYVLATKALVDGKQKVGFMYREEGTGEDSGWRFFAGTEDQAYVDNPDNIQVYDVHTILEIDNSIAPYLNSVAGTAYKRNDATGAFKPISDFGFGENLEATSKSKILMKTAKAVLIVCLWVLLIFVGVLCLTDVHFNNQLVKMRTTISMINKTQTTVEVVDSVSSAFQSDHTGSGTADIIHEGYDGEEIIDTVTHVGVVPGEKYEVYVVEGNVSISEEDVSWKNIGNTCIVVKDFKSLVGKLFSGELTLKEFGEIFKEVMTFKIQ